MQTDVEPVEAISNKDRVSFSKSDPRCGASGITTKYSELESLKNVNNCLYSDLEPNSST